MEGEGDRTPASILSMASIFKSILSKCPMKSKEQNKVFSWKRVRKAMGSLCSFALDQPCQHKPGSKSGNKRRFHQGHTMSLWLWPSSLSSGKEPHRVLCVWKARLNPHTYTIEGTGTAHERRNWSSERLSALSHITQPRSPRARVLIWFSLTPKPVQLLLDSEVSSATHPNVRFGCYRLRKSDERCVSLFGGRLWLIIKPPSLLHQWTGMSFLLFFALPTPTYLGRSDDSLWFWNTLKSWP